MSDVILQPGYVRWDGLKYVTDSLGPLGPTGPSGPTGSTGPAGPGIYKYLYTMSNGSQSTNLTESIPLVIGSTYFNANEIFSISSGKSRTVTFRAELYTNNINHLAYVDLYDVNGITGSVGSIYGSQLTTTSLTPTILQTTIHALQNVTSNGVIDCRLWIYDSTSPSSYTSVCNLSHLEVSWS